MFLLVITGSTYYEVSDNLQIEWLISGVYGESVYEFPRFFQLYGHALYFMYDRFPGIPWMPVLLLLIIYVSGLCIFCSSIQLTKTWDLRLRILIHILILAFLTEFIIYLDFTRAALLCATAGVVLFFSAEKDFVKVLALIFIVAAIALRFMALYYIVLISFIWLLYDFKLNRMLLYYAAVLLLCYLSFGIPSKRFKEYVQLNKAKTLVNDYQLTKTFIPESCLGSWFFLDENTNKNLQETVEKASLIDRFNIKKVEGAFRELKGQLHWVLVVLMICFIIKRWTLILIYMLGFTGLVLTRTAL